MDNLHLYSKISVLPENLKKEVEEFIEKIQERSNKSNEASERVFGSLKGKIKMADDFDDPIDDFKEYM